MENPQKCMGAAGIQGKKLEKKAPRYAEEIRTVSRRGRRSGADPDFVSFEGRGSGFVPPELYAKGRKGLKGGVILTRGHKEKAPLAFSHELGHLLDHPEVGKKLLKGRSRLWGTRVSPEMIRQEISATRTGAMATGKRRVSPKLLAHQATYPEGLMLQQARRRRPPRQLRKEIPEALESTKRLVTPKGEFDPLAIRKVPRSDYQKLRRAQRVTVGDITKRYHEAGMIKDPAAMKRKTQDYLMAQTAHIAREAERSAAMHKRVFGGKP